MNPIKRHLNNLQYEVDRLRKDIQEINLSVEPKRNFCAVCGEKLKREDKVERIFNTTESLQYSANTQYHNPYVNQPFAHIDHFVIDIIEGEEE